MKKTKSCKLVRGFYYRVIDGCGENIIDYDLWYYSGKSLYTTCELGLWCRVSPPLEREVFELIEGLA